MRTNKAKYDFYKAQFDKLEQNFVKSLFPDGLPGYIYIAGRERITRDRVTGATTCQFYDKEKPKRTDVVKIRSFVESPTFNKSQVRLLTEKKYEKWVSRGSESLTRVLKSDSMSFNPWELRAKARELRKKYTLKAGDIRCDYCGAAVPEKEAETYKVISITTYGPGGRWGKYCKGCGILDQMAHEG